MARGSTNDLIKYFIAVEVLFVALVVTLKDVSETCFILYSAGYLALVFLPCMPFLAVLFGLAFFVFGDVSDFALFELTVLVAILGFIQLFKQVLKKQNKLLGFSIVCGWYVFSATLLAVMVAYDAVTDYCRYLLSVFLLFFLVAIASI